MCLFCHFCFKANTTKKKKLEEGVMIMLDVILVKFLMKALFRWAKGWYYKKKLAVDFDVLSFITRGWMIWRTLIELLKLTLYKLWSSRWLIIIGAALSYTSSIILLDEYDKLFQLSISKMISLVSSLLQYWLFDKRILSLEPLMQRTKMRIPIPLNKMTDLSAKEILSSWWPYFVIVLGYWTLFRSYVIWEEVVLSKYKFGSCCLVTKITLLLYRMYICFTSPRFSSSLLLFFLIALAGDSSSLM